ncbi:T9SS type A sorting domain-containing protein [bacterium]|nr:T9SS type A sorting domain-containing protein [bacterium]
MKQLALVALVLSIAFSAFAQRVETVAGPTPRVNNGLVVHSSGMVYASDLFGSGFNGTTINAFTPDGESHTLIASSITRPAGLAFGPDGDLYCAVFYGSKVIRIDAEGTKTDVATGINQPAGLVFDDEGNLYITAYGSNRLYKVTPEGESTIFATGFSQPVGVTRDAEGYIYVADLEDSDIWKVDSAGEKELLCNVEDNPIGFIEWLDGFLYLTATGSNKIYRIAPDGTFEHFAGSGIASSVDGYGIQASFRDPDGIAASPNGDTLYVSENDNNLLRRILLNETSVGETPNRLPESFELGPNYPNPFNAGTRFTVTLSNRDEVMIRVFDMMGRQVTSLHEGSLPTGRTELVWNGLSSGGLRASSGSYFIQAATSQESQLMRVTLLR